MGRQHLDSGSGLGGNEHRDQISGNGLQIAAAATGDPYRNMERLLDSKRHRCNWRRAALPVSSDVYPDGNKYRWIPRNQSRRVDKSNLKVRSRPGYYMEGPPSYLQPGLLLKTLRISYNEFWGSVPDKFYKRRSQEKTHLLRLEFFLLLSPLDRARFVLTYRAMCSVAGQCAPVDWVFSTSGFHRFFATKPVSSETSKAER
jgi:hypothetical protein